MKGLVLGAALTLALAGAASATPSLILTSGSSSITVPGAGSSVTYSNLNFNGWKVSIVFGDSNSPALVPYGIDLTSLTATCTTAQCSTGALDIFLSDTGFTQPVAAGGFINTFSSTQTGTAASATQNAWVSTLNTLFGTGSSIGTVVPLTGAGFVGGAAQGGSAAGPGAYALTIEDIFSAGGQSASFSADGNITSVPEPASVALFGAALALVASRLRRRKQA